jgi:hypothetical protein
MDAECVECNAASSAGDKVFRYVPCVDGSVLARFFERYRTAGRSCHVFGLLMRRCSWPLAIMLSADRVPVKSTRFKWRSGTSGLSRSVGRLAWVRYAIIALSNLVAREAVPRAFVLLPYADAGSGVR